MHFEHAQPTWTSNRQKSFSYGVISQHVINTPKIIRFTFKQPQPNHVASVFQPRMHHSITFSQHGSQRDKQDKVAQRAVLAEKEITLANLQVKKNTKFTVVSRQIKTSNTNRDKLAGQNSSSATPMKSLAQPHPAKRGIQQIKYSLPASHISFQVPPICDFFVCLPQSIPAKEMPTAQKQRREKIFGNSPLSPLLNQSQQFTNEEKTNKKIRKHSEDIRPQPRQQPIQQDIKQCAQSVEEQQIPSCILQGWSHMEERSREEVLGSAALQVVGRSWQ